MDDTSALHQRLLPLLQRANTESLPALPPLERALVVTWWGSGIIGNGGFELFYQGYHRANGDDSVALLADGFRALGFPDAADACLRAQAFFPADVARAEPPAPEVYLDSRPAEEVEAFFGPLNEAVWAIDKEDRYSAAVNAALSRLGL